ncbi:hypothetical protein HYPSUDRAFT_80651 [Hypholoma sublateritium FD-334 SS-4]|uniref:Uncharacterized protein n=1 Tax=Hypholoma sublateritium (strain FD-334 SS-4) TaxID=945553 RepID=A0A0D2KJX9_HYPSF|nr:hypothetical protein HYPSUDRAFT_80651 [Hypholoma sublateritium FD-334 SS-4]
MFTFARAAIQATGLSEYVTAAFTVTSTTAAVVAESHPNEASPEKSVDQVSYANKQNQLTETLASPLEEEEKLEERQADPERVSRMTTRDEDLQRQAKNYKTARKSIPGEFVAPGLSDEEHAMSINPTASSIHLTLPGRDSRTDKNQAEKHEPVLKSKASELSIARKRIRLLEEEKDIYEREIQDLKAELEAEKIVRENYIRSQRLEAGSSDERKRKAGRLAESDEVGVSTTVEVMERAASIRSLGKREHDSDVSFENSERGEKRSRHGHVGNDGGTPTRGRQRNKKTIMDRISRRAASLMPYPKHSKSKDPQSHHDKSGGREVPIYDSPPSMGFPAVTPPASIGHASSKNASQTSGISGNADDESSLEDRGKHISPATPLSPSEESKTPWLLRNLTGRSLSRGPSPSPAYREPAPPKTPTRPGPRPHVMLGAASVPIPASHGLLSPPFTGPRRQTSPLLSSQSSSSKKRKQEDAQAYTIPDANVKSWFGDDPVPHAAGSTSKRRKND